MAKILLNVDLNAKPAQEGLSSLKRSITLISKSLTDIKPNQALTDQIKALSDYYQKIADASKNAREALHAEEIQQQRLAEATSAANRARIEARTALLREREATLDVANAEQRLEEIQEQHEHNQNRRTQQEVNAVADLEKSYADLHKQYENAAKQYPEIENALREYDTQVQNTWASIRAYRQEETNHIETQEVLQTRLHNLRTELASLTSESYRQNEAAKAAQKQMDEWAKSVQAAETKAESMKTQLYNMLTTISNIENRYPAGTFDQLKADIQAQITGLNNLDKENAEYVQQVDEAGKKTGEFKGTLAQLRAETEHAAPAVATLGEKFGNLVERYAKFYASSLLVRKPLQLIQNALSDVGETLVKTEDAVIELNRVLDDPQPAQEISNRLYDMAYQYGSTFENASKIAANFARAGKSWNDSLKATEAALLAMNVAELDATQASDGLLSIIAQFDMQASDLIDVVDKLNKTADKNPVSTQKLLQAIQRAGSAAKNANVSFDQTLGLITAISEATNRSGQNIGTAINSLIQYSTKNVDVFSKLSKESADMVDKFKTGLVSIVDVWNQVAEDIHNDKEARDNIISALGTDGLEELSSTLHDELGDLVSEIDGVYNVANTYRKNYFIALLDNMDRFMDVQKQLTDYQGYSQEENEKYMETYTAKVNQLLDAWQKLANDEQGFLSFKKGLVELGIQAVGLIEWTGGLKETLIGISTILVSIFANIKAVKIGEGLEKIFQLLESDGAILKTFPNILKNIGSKYEEWKAATEALTLATQAQENATLLTELAQRKAAASAALWQSAMGWITIAATAIMLIVNSVNKYTEAQEKAREKAIALGKETSENAQKIEDLRKKQEGLDEKSSEYLEIEDKIVELLGDKKVLLEDLTKGTEEYTQKVKELTEAELIEAQYNAIEAKNAADKNAHSAFNRAKVPGNNLSYGELTRLFAPTVGVNGVEEEYQAYKKIVDELTDYKKKYVRSIAEGNEEEANSYKKYIDVLESWVEQVRDAMEEYATSTEYYFSVSKFVMEDVTAGVAENLSHTNSAARKSSAELQAIAEENGMTLEEVQAVYDRVGQGLAKAAEQTKEAADALDESGNAAENTGAKYDKAGEGVDNFANLMSAQSSALADNIKALETIQAAQEEFASKGALSIETVQKLSALGSDWVYVLFDENGAIDLASDALDQLISKTQEQITESGYLIDKTESTTDSMKDLSAQIDDVQSALATLKEAQAEYEESGSITVDTLQKLLELGDEYLDLIIDEEGQLRINEDAVNDLVESKKELLDQLIAEEIEKYASERLNYYLAKSTEEVGDTAEVAAEQIGKLALAYALARDNAEGVTQAQTALEEYLARKAYKAGAMGQGWAEDYVNDVINFANSRMALRNTVNTSLTGWQTETESKSSSSKTKEKDEELERLESIVSLRESELTLMEHQGKSEEEQIAKIREIQSGIHDVAEYLRATGASQEDINKQMSEWWKWEEKINKFAEDRAKAEKKAAEDAEKAAKEAEKLAEEQRKQAIAALNAETSRHKQVVSDLKAELNLWQKQGKSVSEQVEEIKKIQAALHDEAEWLRQLKATQDDIVVNQADIDALSAEWWDWQEKILQLYKEILEEQKKIELEAVQKTIDAILKEIDLEEEALELSEKRLAVDKARGDLEEAIAKAKIDYVESVLSEYLTALSDAETLEQKQRAVIEAREKLVSAEREAKAKAIIDAFKAEKAVKSDTLSLEEKRLAVEKARQALADAENDRTTRVYNEASGQWEYQANAKNVQSAQENLTKAIEALNAYAEEQAWQEVSEAVEKGSVSEEEVLDILEKWAKESYGNGSPEFVSRIQSAFRKAMGTAASPDSVAGQISSVDNAVKSLNDYLKSEAVKELKAYIAAGNTDTNGMREILNRWLSMGEGSELYDWRDGLIQELGIAIDSGRYDDTKVISQVQAVENAVKGLHDYLQNRFVREITDLARNGTAEEIRAALERWGASGEIDQSRLDWGNRVADAKSNYEEVESRYDSIISGKTHTDEEKRSVMEMMRANSEAWWTASEEEKKRLADLNYMLGTSMGWHRKSDGAWYDERENRVYDKGGVLHGRGGIKATDKPEIILDPELTSKILRPGSEAQFRAFADAMHLMFERGDRTRADRPVVRPVSSVDSHNSSYTVNGIPIPASAAESQTIVELFRSLPAAR